VNSFDSSGDVQRVNRALDPNFATFLVSNLLEIGSSGGAEEIHKKQAKTRSWRVNELVSGFTSVQQL
jgi:hypothetical protein